jgi:uncharacterized membrane protein
MGKKFSSWRYTLQKLTTKLATFRPSRTFIAVLVMAASIFLLGGGIYDILMEPIAAYPLGSGKFLSFIPYQIHEQLLSGSVSVMLLYALGGSGLLMIYRGTRFVRNPRQTSLYTRIGVALIVVSFVAIEVVLYWIMNYPSS